MSVFNNARHLQYTTYWNVLSILLPCQFNKKGGVGFKALFPYMCFKKSSLMSSKMMSFELIWMRYITLGSPQTRTFCWLGPLTSHRCTLCCCWSDDDSLNFLVKVSIWLRLEYSEIPLVFDESTFWLLPSI